MDERRRVEHEREGEKRRQAEVELQIIPHVLQSTLRKKGGAVTFLRLPAHRAVPGPLVLLWCLEKGGKHGASKGVRQQGETFKYLPDLTCDSAISPSSGASGPGTTNSPSVTFNTHNAAFIHRYCGKVHPVEVEQEDDEHGQRSAGRPPDDSQTQSEEELRPWSQSPAVCGDGWSARKTELIHAEGTHREGKAPHHMLLTCGGEPTLVRTAVWPHAAGRCPNTPRLLQRRKAAATECDATFPEAPRPG